MSEPPPIKYPRAVRRLRVRWRDGEWQIVKEMVIPSMTLPKSSQLPEGKGREGFAGFWWEATDAEGRVLYRRVMPDPTEHRVEIVDRDGTFRHLPADAHEAVFDVLVPDLPEIEEIRIFSDREEGEHAAAKGRKRGPSRVAATLKVRRSGEEGGGYGSR